MVTTYVFAGVWGYDKHTVLVLQQMQRESQGQSNEHGSDKDCVDTVGEYREYKC